MATFRLLSDCVVSSKITVTDYWRLFPWVRFWGVRPYGWERENGEVLSRPQAELCVFWSYIYWFLATPLRCLTPLFC